MPLGFLFGRRLIQHHMSTRDELTTTVGEAEVAQFSSKEHGILLCVEAMVEGFCCDSCSCDLPRLSGTCHRLPTITTATNSSPNQCGGESDDHDPDAK